MNKPLYVMSSIIDCPFYLEDPHGREEFLICEMCEKQIKFEDNCLVRIAKDDELMKSREVHPATAQLDYLKDENYYFEIACHDCFEELMHQEMNYRFFVFRKEVEEFRTKKSSFDIKQPDEEIYESATTNMCPTYQHRFGHNPYCGHSELYWKNG